MPHFSHWTFIPTEQVLRYLVQVVVQRGRDLRHRRNRCFSCIIQKQLKAELVFFCCTSRWNVSMLHVPVCVIHESIYCLVRITDCRVKVFTGTWRKDRFVRSYFAEVSSVGKHRKRRWPVFFRTRGYTTSTMTFNAAVGIHNISYLIPIIGNQFCSRLRMRLVFVLEFRCYPVHKTRYEHF